MPSDRYVFHFLEAVKAIHRRLLADVDVLDITAWILRTPKPVKEINQKYLAKFKDLLVPEEGEDESEEDEDDEGEETEDKKRRRRRGLGCGKATPNGGPNIAFRCGSWARQ